jgi:two-component system phosphate regulon response regulator PhoB
MARILIIEDEEDLQQVLKFNLERQGHEVSLTASGSDALRVATRRVPDLILLDVMLPDIYGTDVCRSLRQTPETADVPIIMVTAKGAEQDRVEGLSLGADDYVTKPFSIRELSLRIDAILRRAQPTSKREQCIEFGVLRIDPLAHRAWVSDKEVELSALEFKLLLILHERRNRVQSRTALLDSVWGVTADVTTRTVDTHVKRLREKLGDARSYIDTVRGVGYRFVGSPEDAVTGSS